MKYLMALIMGFSFTVTAVSADTVGCKRAGGVKCQHVKPGKPALVKRHHKRAVVVVPSHHRHYHAFHHPLVTALGVAIIIDAKGNSVTESGQNVVVLGDGADVKDVIEKDGTIYIIK